MNTSIRILCNLFWMTERNQKFLGYCCALLNKLVTQINHYHALVHWTLCSCVQQLSSTNKYKCQCRWLPNLNDNSSKLKCFKKIVGGICVIMFLWAGLSTASETALYGTSYSIRFLQHHVPLMMRSEGSPRICRIYKDFYFFMICQLSSPPEGFYSK